MNNERIRELLVQLHEELRQSKTVDEKGRILLRDLSADIDELLERSGGQPDDSMLQRFQEAIDHLEITHPNLTMALSEMMTILSNAGI
jgi:hypothetical protein